MKPFQSDGTFHPIAEGQGLRRAAVRGAGATIAGQAASFAVQIGSVVILARLLSPADFGIVTMVTTFSLLFRSFGLNGFTELIMQREEMSHSLASNLFWLNLGIGTILTLAFAASGSLLALFYHNPAVAEVTKCMSLTIGLGCLGWIHLGLLQRAMRFRTTAIIGFVGQLLLVLVTIVLALAGWHYWALVWGSVTQVVVVAAAAWANVPMGTELATPRVGNRFRFEVCDERLFAFRLQLLDPQYGQHAGWLAVRRAIPWIL